MTEEEFIEKLCDCIPDDDSDVSKSVILLADEAVGEFPLSKKLWCIRAQLIQWGDDDNYLSLEDSLKSYQKALSIDPKFIGALEGIGRYYDSIDENLDLSEKFFRKALALGGGEDTYYGLARVLAQKNQNDAALSLLRESGYINTSNQCHELAGEISEGIWTNDYSD